MDSNQQPKGLVLPRTPFRVEYEITGFCNLDCVYCYAKPLSHEEPSFEQLEYLFKKTQKEVNPFEVALVGGEPFMRKDIISILQMANSIFETAICVSTNGTLLCRLSKGDLEELKALYGYGAKNLGNFQISLDSIDPAINERTRGLTSLTIKGMDALEQNGIPFAVSFVITSFNSNFVANTVEHLLKAYKNAIAITVEPLQKTITMDNKTYELLRVPITEFQLVIDDIKSVIQESGRIDITVHGGIDMCMENEFLLNTYNFKICTAGLLRASVLTNGDVVPCFIIRNQIVGNVYREPWETIWKRSLERFLQLNLSNVNNSAQCLGTNNLLRTEREKQKTHG